MNSTAEKLREAAAYMNDGMVGSASAITVLRDMFDVKNANTFGEDLGLVLDIIADELDELQARAAGANNMRQRLESAEKKAERRKKQVEHTEDAIRERNARLKMRGETIARLTAENGKLCKQVPSERERHILDIWPRFEDGEPVMLGDKYEDNEGHECFASEVYLDIDGLSLVDSEGFPNLYRKGKSVKRPAPKVLDADGVEIKVGDTVYGVGRSQHSFDVIDPHHIDPEVGEAFSVRCYDRDEHEECHCKPKLLTHTRPDSWERFVEDLQKSVCGYFGFADKGCDGCPASGPLDCNNYKTIDLVRRANALAGIEVAE